MSVSIKLLVNVICHFTIFVTSRRQLTSTDETKAPAKLGWRWYNNRKPQATIGQQSAEYDNGRVEEAQAVQWHRRHSQCQHERAEQDVNWENAAQWWWYECN